MKLVTGCLTWIKCLPIITISNFVCMDAGEINIASRLPIEAPRGHYSTFALIAQHPKKNH